MSEDLTKWTRNEQNKKTIDKFVTSIVLYTIFIALGVLRSMPVLLAYDSRRRCPR